MAGHKLLAPQASRMGMSNVVTCRKCSESITVMLVQFIYLCPTSPTTRQKYLKALQFKELVEVSKLDIMAHLDFVKRVDVLHDNYFS